MSAFDEDCRRAAVIITRLKAPPTCQTGFLLDAEALSARGATTIRFMSEAVEVRSVKKGSERLPWLNAGAPPAEEMPARERPRQARPVPEQDLPEEEISTGEPD